MSVPSDIDHITVCICSYKRPHLLRHLLDELAHQDTQDRFTYSILVVDNDAGQTAKHVVADFATKALIQAQYAVEPHQNIALARNRAVENATGNWIAFIDDDEFPIRDWLLTLFLACHTYKADGVLGPVKPHFDETPPQWVIKGKFYDRRTYPTGLLLQWRNGRTGNLLLKTCVFKALDIPFRPEFRAGEDQDFFRRAIAKGFRFVWCNEALAYETVPPLRWKRTVMLRRALLRGATAALDPTLGIAGVTKSLIAVLMYTAALPLALLSQHHWFMIALVRLCDHLGKLLALISISPIQDPYITD